ncbi:hypothetical protein OFN97_07610 [Campylobacter sp. VBCF_05 NA6]|uniref:hypothetical protein n=1 Tax=unclassified Campylobacter TaxID=2593542 RepID=UPI0022E9AB69|nr:MULTISPECIES: hypothetical protein [unclassified Campylobacter]MDA3058300.1 hypothetical protein [Campylobacter sp. VBCF_04 NA7]MDA3059870.1 hypothetical protein [Campylobacter sp. VBCF_05 NA6]
MFYKFCYTFIGFGFLSISLGIFANKKFKRFAIEHDFSNAGYFYIFVAIAAFMMSFAFFYLAFRSEKNTKKYKQDYMKCLECGEVCKYMNTKEGKCPKCNGETMEIEMYYRKQRLDENKTNENKRNKKHKKRKIKK